MFELLGRGIARQCGADAATSKPLGFFSVAEYSRGLRQVKPGWDRNAGHLSN